MSRAVLRAHNHLAGYTVIVSHPDRELHISAELLHFVEHLLIFLNRADSVFVAVKRPDRQVFDPGRINELFGSSKPLPADGAAAAKYDGSS